MSAELEIEKSEFEDEVGDDEQGEWDGFFTVMKSRSSDVIRLMRDIEKWMGITITYVAFSPPISSPEYHAGTLYFRVKATRKASKDFFKEVKRRFNSERS